MTTDEQGTVGAEGIHPGVASIPPLAAARALRTSDRVYEELAAGIREVRLVPGQVLSESDLSRRLGVSRTPVREAISRLVENGLVRVVPQVGTRVSPIRLADVKQAQFIREHLELGAFAVGCALDDRDTSGLTAAIARQRAAQKARDFDAFFAADEAFHEAIFAVSGYAGAWDAVHRTKLQLDRIRRLASATGTVRELISEHAEIAEALAAGDVQRGRVVLERHTRRVLTYAPALSQSFPDYFESE